MGDEAFLAALNMALRLARLLGGSADSWLNMQRSVDLWEQERERREVYDRIEPVASSAWALRRDTRAMTTEPAESGGSLRQVCHETGLPLALASGRQGSFPGGRLSTFLTPSAGSGAASGQGLHGGDPVGRALGYAWSVGRSSDRRSGLLVNRAPVLTLWAAVVAEQVGSDRAEALTLGRVVAGLNA